MKMTSVAGSGHLGGCLSSAEILAVLFGRSFLHRHLGRYLFVLSVGHLAPLLYAVMARVGNGNDLRVRDLCLLRRFKSGLQGHPVLSHEEFIFPLRGLFCGSGSLGQGLSIAAGAAKFLTMKHEEELPVYVLLGDGELQEGQVWEAAMFAAHHGLRNLVAIVDWNGQQLDGTNDEVMSLGDLPAKWGAFGWEVAVVDGHSCRDIDAALRGFSSTRSPKVLLAKTEMGHGIPEIANQSAWHGKVPSEMERGRFLEALDRSFAEVQSRGACLPFSPTLEPVMDSLEIEAGR